MRTIERTGQFKKDFKREVKGRHRATLETDLAAILIALAQDRSLPAKFRDHALTGNWVDHRDCHIKPDLVLLYQRIDSTALRLVRLGSHAELGL